MIKVKETSLDQIEFLRNTVEKLTLKIKEKDDELEKLKNNTTTSSSIKSNSSAYYKSDDVNKVIVRLYANAYSPGFILKIMNDQKGFSTNLRHIETICTSVDGDGSHQLNVEDSLMEYYIEQKQLFIKNNSIDKGFFATSLYKKLKLVEDDLTACLVEAQAAGDPMERRKVSELLIKLYERSAVIFSKNTLNIFSKKEVAEIGSDYDEATNSMFGEEPVSDKIVYMKKKTS